MKHSRSKSNALFITLLLVLTYAYAWGLHFLPSFDRPPWESIALLNTGLALLSYGLWRSRTEPSGPASERFAAWAIGPLLLTMTLIGVAVSRQIDSVQASAYPYSLLEIIGLCLWVPIVEEIIFRRFIGEWIGLRLDGLWAIYFSGLVFALAHTSPPLSPWPPLGPFLLGCACTWSYRASGRLMAPVLLHAAGNASAILFTLYAPTWLDMLSWLYQKL